MLEDNGVGIEMRKGRDGGRTEDARGRERTRGVVESDGNKLN